MISYSALLNTAEWRRFRAAYLEHRRNQDGELWCDDCGSDTFAPLHVHHRIYKSGRLPWEYDFSDLRLVCRDCHQRIHDTEEFFRGFIRSLPPHICYEALDLLNSLMELDEDKIKVALARAKNAVREVHYLHEL